AVTNSILGGAVSVLLGTGDGDFDLPRNFNAGLTPLSVAVGDFNGDGALDLAVANGIINGSVSLLLGTGDRAFEAARHRSAGNGPRSVATGDFNGDGLLDLAVAGFYDDQFCKCFRDETVRVLLGSGDGSFGAARPFSAGSLPSSVAVADFDG